MQVSIALAHHCLGPFSAVVPSAFSVLALGALWVFFFFFCCFQATLRHGNFVTLSQFADVECALSGVMLFFFDTLQ